MTKLFLGFLGLFGLSILTYTLVVVVSDIYRVTGRELWPGTTPETNWPTALVYVSLGSMVITAGVCALLLILIGVRAALRGRQRND